MFKIKKKSKKIKKNKCDAKKIRKNKKLKCFFYFYRNV